MSKKPLKPNIDEWPQKMQRLWTEADILAMPATRDEALPSFKATVHYFAGVRCGDCLNVAPWLVESNMCTVCKHYEDRQCKAPRGTPARVKTWRKKTDALGFGYGEMPGGGCGYRMLRPPLQSIGKPDDAATNKAKRASCRKGWVRDHTIHVGWPLADGCKIIGLEVAENLLPMPQALNKRKENHLPDPADWTHAADRPLSIAEQREFVRRRMAIWAQDLVFDEVGKLVRAKWELYRFADDGAVEYLGVEPSGAAAEAAE